MQQCIYCLEEFSKENFTREHVIPKAFGIFNNNLTLIDMVCGECNQYFGDNLELYFARGSLEGIMRFEVGIKPPENADSILRDRIKLKVKSQQAIDGLIVSFSNITGHFGIEPVPQVRFRHKHNNSFIYINLSELQNSNFELPSDADQTDIALLAKSDEMKADLKEALANNDIHFTQQYEEEISERSEPNPMIEVSIALDQLVFRTVAKICFNYFAYVTRKDLVLADDFNDTRSFIRWGKQPNFDVVSTSTNPILHYDSRRFRQTNGHLVTIDWPSHSNIIASKLSLFNWVTYQVILSRNCKRVWRNIKSGHHFNFMSRQVEPLGALRKDLLP